jgi:twitching motility protein PilU
MAVLPIEDLLQGMVEKQASDLYLTYNAAPHFRVGDTLIAADATALDHAALDHYVKTLLSEDQQDEFASTLEFNTGMNFRDGLARFRINVLRQQQYPAIVIRRIQTDIPTATSLGLSPVYTDLVMEKRGLILVVGPTGSGKTTSLASMIGHRNRHGSGHIITVEDPIEYLHQHDNCIITQRDVGLDTYSFSIALKNALRQRPDVVVIGEIRDREVMEQALYFSETGHLCLATLHASNASQAIERVLNFFPEDRHQQILLNLSLNVQGIFSQRLVPDTRGGRALAMEVMLNNGLMKQLIEEGQIRKMRELIEQGTGEGMHTFDQHLFSLFTQGIISADVAIAEADSPANVRLAVKKHSLEHGNTIGGVSSHDHTSKGQSHYHIKPVEPTPQSLSLKPRNKPSDF